MTRDEVNADGTEWLIPASRYKGEHDHLIPLSAAAQKMPGRRNPEGRQQGLGLHQNGTVPICGFSKFKRQFDGKVLQELRKHDPKRHVAELVDDSRSRRTARSLM